MKTKILSISALFCVACGMVSAATYSLNTNVFPANIAGGAWNWNSTKDVSGTTYSIWSGTVGVNGPLSGDTISLNGSYGTTNSNPLNGTIVSVLEIGAKIGGVDISSSNYTRNLAKVSVSADTPARYLTLAGGYEGLNSSQTLLLQLNNLTISRGAAAFFNSSSLSDSTQMDVVIYGFTKGNNGGNFRAGYLDYALKSFTFDCDVDVYSGTGNSMTFGFDNVTDFVKFTGVVNATAALYTPITNFTKVGTSTSKGEIHFKAADQGVLFATVSFATIKNVSILGTEVIFDGLDVLSADFSDPITLMTWNTLSGATAQELLDNIKASNDGYDFSLSEDSKSILFTGVIPEPAEVASLIGLIALGFVIYRRRK